MSLVTRIAITSVLFFLLLTIRLSAQPITFSLPFVNNAAPNVILNMPVKVTGFDSITSAQFVLSWDPQVLKFLTVDSYNLPGLGADDFNATFAADSGFVRFAYEAANLDFGASVPDNSTIFRLRLKVIGALNTSSPVKFIQKLPVYYEVSRIEGTSSIIYSDTAIVSDHGFVAVGYTVDAQEEILENNIPLEIFPNPFSEAVNAVFELQKAAEVEYSIVDPTGKVVLKNKKWYPAGKTGIVIESTALPNKGYYTLIIRTGDQKAIRQIICFEK